MKPGNTLLILAALLLCGGCNSLDAQRRRFVEMHNAQVGLPFYAYEKEGMREAKISPTRSEFVPDPVPSTGCGVAWMVDTTSRGPYHHPNGMTFDIEGTKMSWRFEGDPARCLDKLQWFPLQ